MWGDTRHKPDILGVPKLCTPHPQPPFHHHPNRTTTFNIITINILTSYIVCSRTVIVSKDYDVKYNNVFLYVCIVDIHIFFIMTVLMCVMEIE